ncbi:MAG TPA: hypothetical protein VKS79_21690 [Gemmataceae bacterium]|nr:hypothetical protein [Gemmataceae bacterium]
MRHVRAYGWAMGAGVLALLFGLPACAQSPPEPPAPAFYLQGQPPSTTQASAQLPEKLPPPEPEFPYQLPKLTDPSLSQTRPPVLTPPDKLPAQPAAPAATEAAPAEFLLTPVDPPLGYTGPSGVLPRVGPGPSPDYLPTEVRWRIGFPEWDRYQRGHPRDDDYPYMLGNRWDPYNQNVLKGDYPIIGQHTFFIFTASSLSLFEPRAIPSQTTPFESTLLPGEFDFFGRPNQIVMEQFFRLSFDLFHGDAAFKPVDWRIRLTPVFNMNFLTVSELAQVSPDVTFGDNRFRVWGTLEEYFVEKKLFDLSPEYDFMSIRFGSQPFTSDFRGFIFSDTNRAVRLFGTLNGNRDQFNLIYFRPAEKDTNSGLNTFYDRNQNILIANYYRQDFIFPGYTIEGSIHYDNDRPSFKFDTNGFLVRPDPTGVFQQHEVNAVYLGLAGDGHIGPYNISHAFYWVVGRDSINPIGNTPQDINAEMAAVELSYDRDWARFRTSMFWASGDGNPNDHHATGFDTIMDNPNFAGGEFSFWQRQVIPLFGVQLVQRQSLVPDLRSSKIQGQPNFVNPGLWLVNAGMDFDITPKLRSINNVNYLWFDKTAVLQTFLFDSKIDRNIGTDLSTGVEYRPFLNNRCILIGGISSLIPSTGFSEIYSRLRGNAGILIAGFIEVNLAY